MEVVASKATLEQCQQVAIGILIGQRTTTSDSKGNQTQKCALLCVVPCTDMSVVVEQVECIEQVLPANLQFVGVVASSNAPSRLLPLFKDHADFTKLVELRTAGAAVRASCLTPIGNGMRCESRSATVSERELRFVSIDCTVHAPLTSMPLLVTASNGETLCVDLESDQPICLPATFPQEGLHKGQQLGCAAVVTPSFPAIVCLSESSGSSLWSSLQGFVSRLAKSTTKGNALHVVPSARYTPLIYCHACDAAILCTDLEELIEDGMSETVSAAAAQKGATEEQKAAVGRPHSHQANANAGLARSLLLIAACVAILAVVYSVT